MNRLTLTLCVLFCLVAGPLAAAPRPDDAGPPDESVKLIFVHHSTGGNWLADPNSDQPYGGLGRALMENNYFVSATNYGWGPDGIGDRTDIVNWPEWFLGPRRDAILDALYNESGQNIGDFGAWPRLPTDPGGENRIIMFKSCFPNSDLYGDPDDAAYAEYNQDEYSVANAKAIYNALLGYFETRQDKLFVVITAPPLVKSATTRGRAANARAFNLWLVNEWLRDYPYANVAVFDYYNVLTDPDNHHRWTGTGIEHVHDAGNNVAAYPSGDSHPATEGHTKATEEFVPLLNVYYHRWQAGAPEAPPTVPPTSTAAAPEPTATPEPEPPPDDGGTDGPTGTIDAFEGELAWQPDIGEGAEIACERDPDAAHGGDAALRIAYAIPEGSWGGCGRYYDTPQDWSAGDGLSLWVRGDEANQWIMLAVFAGDPDAPTPFEFGFEPPATWTQLVIPWDRIERAPWADATGLAALDPAQVTGFGFSIEAGEGHLWVDDVALVTGGIPEPAEPEPPGEAEEPEPAEPTAEEAAPAEEIEAPSGGGLCASAPLALAMVAVGLVTNRRREQER
jgi:hypothetical protein